MKVKIVSKIKSTHVVFRATSEDGNLVAYRSTRLGDIKSVTDGYEVDLPTECAGCKYELKSLVKKKIIASGSISLSKNKLKINSSKD